MDISLREEEETSLQIPKWHKKLSLHTHKAFSSSSRDNQREMEFVVNQVTLAYPTLFTEMK